MRSTLTLALIGLGLSSATAAGIDFSQIQNWTGEGPNQAALVVQYNSDIYGNDALVWGYRWADGETPTGEDMFRAICKASSRLSLLTQKTGTMGSTVCGIGYGLNQKPLEGVFFDFEKAKNSQFINFDYYNSDGSSYGQTQAPGDETPAIMQAAIEEAKTTHIIEHPLNQPNYGYPAYDYDCWLIPDDLANLGPANLETKWKASWYEGYWSFFTGTNGSDQWNYSGVGMTGRTLSNGSVDGWSYTQFDEPMVGGVGTGTAPCGEGVYIYYVPARLTESGIDASRAVRSAGEGDLTLPVLIHWGERKGIDNVVYSYHFNSTIPSVSQILSDIAQADNALKVEGAGSEVTISFDANSDGSINTASASSDVSASGNWTVTEYEDALLISRDDAAQPAYAFYLPEKTATGAWVPDELSYNLSDNVDYIPVLVQPEAGYSDVNYSWYRRTDAEEEHNGSDASIVSGIATGSYGNGFGALTYKGTKLGTVYLHVRARVGKNSNGAILAYSNICKFTLEAPEIPLESLSFDLPEIASPLSQTIENAVTFTPANATFTGITTSSTSNSVATISGSTPNALTMKTGTAEGSATLSIAYKLNPEITASFNVTAALTNPVTDIHIKGFEGDTITLTPKEMVGVLCDITPANADIQDVNVVISENGADRSELIASIYRVNYWDLDNNRFRFYELSGHRVGQCKLTVSATDGSGFSKDFVINVVDSDRTPVDFTDGTIILNEEWFGHTNGGLNFLTSDNEVIYQAYERANPGMSFGCTSQHGTIWNDKFIVASKQAQDGGDCLPGGGRLVVAEASTLERLGSLDVLAYGDESGDGRAVCGATENKIYVSASNGIYIVSISDPTAPEVIGKITDCSGQFGDMVNAGKYVFALGQSAGLVAIDVDTDTVVKTYGSASAVTMTGDGTVWFASNTDGHMQFVPVDATSLEAGTAIDFPAEIGTVSTGWGAWRSAALYGSPTDDTLWFMPGGGSIVGGGTTYYKYTPGDDTSLLTPFFTLEGVTGVTVMDEVVGQQAYGTPRYDYRLDKFIVMTTHKSPASGQYRDNWIHVVDPKDGSIIKTITLRPYYWFQSLPIIPDTARAELSDEFSTAKFFIEEAESRNIDLAEWVSDADSYNTAIRYELPAETDENAIVDASLEGSVLTLTPKVVGEGNVIVYAVSNGCRSAISIPVVVDTTTGISLANSDHSIKAVGNRVYINGYNGCEFQLYTAAGIQVANFTADSDNYIAEFGLNTGIYVLRTSGASVKIAIK